MLKHGRGLAIQAWPETGMLEAYAEICVELTAFNDMWGSYEDEVVVVVGELVSTPSHHGMLCLLTHFYLYFF